MVYRQLQTQINTGNEISIKKKKQIENLKPNQSEIEYIKVIKLHLQSGKRNPCMGK